MINRFLNIFLTLGCAFNLSAQSTSPETAKVKFGAQNLWPLAKGPCSVTLNSVASSGTAPDLYYGPPVLYYHVSYMSVETAKREGIFGLQIANGYANGFEFREYSSARITTSLATTELNLNTTYYPTLNNLAWSSPYSGYVVHSSVLAKAPYGWPQPDPNSVYAPPVGVPLIESFVFQLENENCYQVTHPNGPNSYRIERKVSTSPAASKPLNTPKQNLKSIDFGLSLGASNLGTEVGSLNLVTSTISSDTYTPLALSVANVNDYAEELYEGSYLRQVKIPSGLVDVVADANGYELRYYSPDAVGAKSTFYAVVPNAIPVITYRFSNPSPGNTDAQLLIVRTKPSETTTYSIYTQKMDGIWTLETGELSSEGLKTPRHKTSLLNTIVNTQPLKVFTEEDYVTSNDTLKTINRNYTTEASLPYKDRLHSLDYADGKREIYDYVLGDYNASTHDFSALPTGTYLEVSAIQGKADDVSSLIPYKSTRNTTIQDADGNILKETFFLFDGNVFQTIHVITHTYDANKNLIQSVKNGQIVYDAIWNVSNKISETNEVGIRNSFTYLDGGSSSPRLLTSTKEGVASFQSYPAQTSIQTRFTVTDGGVYEFPKYTTSLYSQDNTLYLTSSETRDSSSRIMDETKFGQKTSYQYNPDKSGDLYTTFPNGSTSYRVTDDKGRLLYVVGTAVAFEFHTYGDNPDNTTWKRVDYGSVPPSPAYLTRTFDTLGRLVREERPASVGTHVKTYHYNTLGQPVRETATGFADRLYVYNDLGELYRSGLDVDGDGSLTPASNDLIQQTETLYVLENGIWFLVNTQSSFHTVGDATPTVVSVLKKRLTFPPGMKSQTISINDAGAQTTQTVTADREHALVTETTTFSTFTGSHIRIFRNGLLQSEQFPYQTQPTTYNYDGLGRILSTTDPRVGTTATYRHNSRGIVDRITTGSVVTSYTYNSFNQVTQQASAGKITNYAYDLLGNVVRIWGDTYPVRYDYDDLGRRVKMRTYRTAFNTSLATWPEGDATTWDYHPATGQLIAKTDAASQSTTFTYHPSGALATRRWARGVVSTYSYDALGQLEAVSYSDGTPAVGFSYGRDGRPLTQTDAAGLRTFSYDGFNRLSGETYTNGELAGLSVSYSNDAYGRVQNYLATFDGTSLASVGYTYEPVKGRLETITAGTFSATYAYANQSLMVSGITHASAGLNRLETTRTWDSLDRLESQDTRAPGAPNPLTRMGYHYDSRSQRDTADLADNTRWAYTYNAKGEVTGGRQLLSDQTTVIPGTAHTYEYDSIGNATTTTVNGRTALASANALNQYSQRQVPGAVDVNGAAQADVRIAVNGVPAARATDRFSATVPVPNTTAPAYPAIEVAAAQNQNGVDVYTKISDGGRLFVPQTPEIFAYDLDGNLTQDGRWNYWWDAENRLTRMQTRPEVAAAVSSLPVQILEFSYDATGRRITKKVYQAVAQGWSLLTSRKFIYDGWNLVAELDALNSNATLASYMWGVDLSDTMQGAGGVGGLLSITNASGTHYPAYDGNGNVLNLLDATTATVTATYSYGPFGELLTSHGPAAIANPFQFSTKYSDAETGLLYYGFRYYSAKTRRWINRDPINEAGGLNLYGFIDNDTVGSVDILGLILAAFDGTGNDDGTDNPNGGGDAWTYNGKGASPTNVSIMRELYNGPRLYKWGVGTRTDKLTGNLFGNGIGERLDDSLKELKKYLKTNCDEQIDIIGFSRGAASGRIFANMIKKEIPWAKVRFLGIFDTVSQIGAPNPMNYQFGYNLDVDTSFVGFTAHAVAMDEHRSLFPMTSVFDHYNHSSWLIFKKKYRPGEIIEIKTARAHEMPFTGVHSDIGGSYQDGRNVAALEWMITQGQNHGAPFNNLSKYDKVVELYRPWKRYQHDERYPFIDRIPFTKIGRYKRTVFPGNNTSN